MISGVVVRPLKRIKDSRGEVRHMLKRSDPSYTRFGEIYFSVVNPGWVKGWHIHTRMTLNYAIVSGKAQLVLYDARTRSKTRGKFQKFVLSLDNYFLVTIPPGVWNGFKGLGKEPAVVANCATHEHDFKEILRLDPFGTDIPYDWGKCKGGC
jgi:dTDP-4-dehydrorhamnose 3,5-epimerase